MANQMRGQIQIANDIGIRGNAEMNIQPLPSSGIDSAMGAVAQQFAGIGERIGQMADKAAAREGDEAGRVAGLDPEFRPMRTHTIRGDAFDKAGLDVAETRLRQEVENQFDAAYTKHAGDVTKLNASLNATQSGILMHAPEELRPQLQLLMRGKRLAYSREQARKAAAEAAAASKAAMEQQVSDTLKGLHQRAYALGLDAEADQVLAADVAALKKTLGRRGPDGSLLVNAGQAAKYMDGVNETVATARLTGAFSRLPGLAAKEEFLKQLDADFAGSRGLAKVYDLQGFERIKGHLESDLRSARTEQRAQIGAVAADIKSTADMAKKGFAPSPAELSGLKARVLAANDAETAQAMQTVEDTIAWQSAARRATPAELDQFVQAETVRMKQDGATPQGVARLDMANGLLKEQSRALKEDPHGWAATTGLAPITPLDFSDPEKATATLRARLAQSDALAEYYGQPVPALRPDEKKQLAMEMANGGDAAMEVASRISHAAGDRAVDVIRELSDNAPVVTVLGTLVAQSGGAPVQVAIDAFYTLAARKERTAHGKPLPAVVMPKATDVQQALSQTLGNAMEPRNAAAIVDAASFAYEMRAVRAEVQGFDADMFKQAIAEAVGERTVGGVKYGGVVDQAQHWWNPTRKIVLPPEVKQDSWRDVIGALSPSVLDRAGIGQPVSESGKPIDFDRIKKGTLVPAGSGKYYVALGDVSKPGQEHFVKEVKTTGAPRALILDFSKISPVLRRIRPDLFM